MHNTAATMKSKKIICIAGPTGTGKSAIAARLGAALGGEVLNADSRQVYADFPIITAQPGAEETSLCPHHLYGFLPPEKKMSAGQYAKRAEELIKDLIAQGKTPIVVGGTGLYFRSLLKGIADIPQVEEHIHQKWQARAAAEGSPALHRELAAVDGAYAAKIHPNDKQRVTRALEVFEATGRTFSWWHQHSPLTGSFDYLYLGIGLPLQQLEPVLGRRIEAMLAAGALEEARAALAKCQDQKAPGWSGIGCAELYRHLAGKLDLDDAAALWRRNTRAYAKRQLTWFRAEPEIRWFTPHDYHAILEVAKAALSI